MKVVRPVVVALSSCLLFGQLSPVAYSDSIGPLFSSELASTLFPGNYASIRKVDFRNLSYPDVDIKLRDGHFQHDEPGDHQEVELGEIHYLKGRSSSSGQSALVLSSWIAAGGSSSQGAQARVFTVSGGRLSQVQVIAWDTHSGVRPANSFDAKTNVLLIRSDHYIPGDAHCCISAVDAVTFHWNGTHFVQTDIRTELSDYGKREGKALPQP